MVEKKSNTGVLVGVIGLLVVVLAVAVYMLLDVRGKLSGVTEELAESKEFFRYERDSLERELRNIYYRYDTLQTIAACWSQGIHYVSADPAERWLLHKSIT